MTAAAYVPLSFAPGEAYQFDWSHEIVLLDGVTTTVKVAHIRLCHSRMLFVRAYPRESQEMVFDAHDRAFAFFKGACTRGIYDNMKTAVEAIFVGKERQFNRRFLQMCSHYLVEPVACTPASGWEKGQVENQVGLVRERFFTPRLRFKSYDELNAWLLDRCVAYAKAHPHPEVADKTVWEVFEAERPKLVPYAGRFDGFHAVPASVSKTCLVRFDNNKYSVHASAVGRPVEVHAYADRIVIRQDGEIVGEHARVFGRGETIYDPGITCRFWRASPARCATARRSRTGCCRQRSSACGASSPARDDGDRQMVEILAAVLDDGLTGGGGRLRRGPEPGRPFRRRHPQHSGAPPRSAAGRRRSSTPEALKLRHAPVADCARYDQLRRTADGTHANLRSDGRTQALRHAGRLRRGDGRPASSASMSRRASSAICSNAEIAEKHARSIKYQMTDRQTAAGQGHRRLRLRRHADQ